MPHPLSRSTRRGTHSLLLVMTDYESESSGTREIRRLRGEAADTTLSPGNVRRVVQSVRSPAGRTMATHYGHEGSPSSSRAAEAAEILDRESQRLLQAELQDMLQDARPSGVGVGTSPSARPVPSTSGVGVGTSPAAAPTPTPSTSRAVRSTGVGSNARPARGRTGGKEPRRTPLSRIPRTVRNMPPDDASPIDVRAA